MDMPTFGVKYIKRKISYLEARQSAADAESKSFKSKQEIKMAIDDLYKIKANMLCQKARVNWHLKGEKTRNSST